MKACNRRTLAVALGLVLASGRVEAGDQTQWGEYGTRNNVSSEKGLPEWFDPGQVDPATGKVLSQIRVRSEIHNTPVAADGVLYLATWRHLYAIQGTSR